MARVAAGPAGEWAQLTTEAIGVYAHRAGLTTREMLERAGITPSYYYARLSGRLPLTLNDVEALCKPLKATPLEIAQLAAKLSEVQTPQIGASSRD